MHYATHFSIANNINSIHLLTSATLAALRFIFQFPIFICGYCLPVKLNLIFI